MALAGGKSFDVKQLSAALAQPGDPEANRVDRLLSSLASHWRWSTGVSFHSASHNSNFELSLRLGSSPQHIPGSWWEFGIQLDF